jgi:hypothetical protein
LSNIYFINNDRPHGPVWIHAALAIRDEKGSPVQNLQALNFRVWRLLDYDFAIGGLARWVSIPVRAVFPQRFDPADQNSNQYDKNVDLRGMYWLQFGYEPGLPTDDRASVAEYQFAQHVFAIDVSRFRIGLTQPWTYSGRTLASVVVHHGGPEPQWDDEGHFIPPGKAADSS